MPKYNYQGIIQNDGIPSKGVVAATSEIHAATILDHKGIDLITIKQQPAAYHLPFGRKKQRMRSLISLFSQLSVMLHSGMPILESLNSIQSSMKDGEMKDVIEDLLQHINGGSVMSHAMKKHPKIFNKLTISITQGAESTGSMAEAMNYLSSHFKWTLKMETTIKQAAMEPAITACFALAFVILGVTVIIPSGAEILSKMHTELPPISRFLVELGSFIKDYYVHMITIIISAAITFKYYHITSDQFRLYLAEMKFKMPVFGGISQMLATSKFIHHLNAMYHAGLPLLECIESASNSTENIYMERSILRCRDIFESGESSFAGTLHKERLFEPMIINMIDTGENTGSLDDSTCSDGSIRKGTLTIISDYLDDEIPSQIEYAMTIIKPVVLIIIGSTVALMISAVFGPMFTIMENI